MRPFVETLEGDPSLPGEVDIVVIGGGIVGCSAALRAAELGHRVALVEKGRIAGEQSSRNWGWVRRMGRDVAEYPLGIESLRIWDTLAQRLGHETGFRRSGIVYTAHTDAEMAWIEKVAADADRFGIGAQRLTRAQLAERFPGASLPARAGLFTEDDGRAEPSLAAPAIARGARVKGAKILTGCAVRSIETSAGAVSGVVTERGTIRCRSVILAGGAWSRLFLGNLGIDLPQLRVRGSVLRTAPLKGGPAHALGNGDFGIRPRLDGGYTISRRGRARVQITPDSFRLLTKFLPALRKNRGELALTVDRGMWDGLTTARRWADDAVTPFERCRVLDPEPREAELARTMRAVEAAFPAFKDARIAQKWGGIIDVTPDAVPVIGPAAQIPGLTLATGFSGHGFGIGPAAGQLAVELATGAAPLVDPTPFRADRFGTMPATAQAAE
ncbi:MULTISPECIES: NAD(P)/FAD-dependent oxidoreductase [Salipiger]|jgi:glycine/D-amino acid oxidase-like deaminating enzyme|uniref:Glycine/D-amino acid oxidase, deaminating n=1 Tax=Salipiger profundus TaxID=1229727 RepID=A0A1U7D7N0_9RHOB|nr:MULTISPECIES: FAD-binding oxidoreductase [Salipiger]APX24139.1 glycine/D-amino acid oxidase, deaminating [Salipiger profundus]SFB89998.1 Glycine/D-amino acid oxidase [Salipiger profundus]